MRSSVVVISSVNGSFSASRGVRVDGMEPELSYPYKPTTHGARPVKGRSRTGKPRNSNKRPQPTRREIMNEENPIEQVPFPRFDPSSSTASGDRSVSTCSGDEASLGCPENASGPTTVVPQESVLTQCFAFLKHFGANLIMPPYTVEEGLNDVVTQKNDYINLNASVSRIPLM